jgi:hypothetical protein
MKPDPFKKDIILVLDEIGFADGCYPISENRKNYES